MRKLSLSLCLVVSFTALGQVKPKIKVKVECTCADKVGAQIATAFRDKLATSPRYAETSLTNETIKNGGESHTVSHWVVDMISIPDDDQNSAALSIVLRVGDSIFLHHWAQVCGTAKIDSCTSTLFSLIDSEIQQVETE